MDRIRTFRAASMPEALALVKREFGGNAVILGTRAVQPDGIGRLVRREWVEITASAGGASPGGAGRGRGAEPPAAPQRNVALPEHVHRYYQRLVENDVAHEIAERLARSVLGPAGAPPRNESQTRRRLQQLIARTLPPCETLSLAEGRATRIALLGPAGGGKTTTLAKLAAHFWLKLRRPVAIISLDLFRLAAHEQMRRYGEIIGVPVHTVGTASDVSVALKATADAALVLIDTPGVSPGDSERLAHVSGLLDALSPDGRHLVLPGTMADRARQRCVEAFNRLAPTHVVLTRLDEAVGFGVVLNALDSLRLKLSYLTTGQRVPGDIIPACSDRLAELVLHATSA
ncbi:MAG: Flagellar biosynthesis protein FlhF [Phycisphaerae bacterium]|nr:Flagellar biosynthesis protein FlhF [Phycisphaerae bacterium]